MKKILKWVFIGLLAIILLGAVFGGADDQPDIEGTINSDSSTPAGSVATPPPAKEPEPAKPDFEIIESKFIKEQYISKITGTIKNNTNKEYGYAQVEINLYDDSGAQVGSTLSNCNNFEAGGIWKFEAMVAEDNATKFKIKDITAF